MSRKGWRVSRPIIALGVFGLAVGLLVGLNVLISGLPSSEPMVGVPDDWTHHHLVFSNPGTAAEALTEGRLGEWYRIVNDPRYNMQQMKRNPVQRAMVTASDFASRMALLSPPTPDSERLLPPRGKNEALKKDWSMIMGATTTAKVGAGQYPAKYSFSYTAASCSDFVVYNTGATGSGTQPSIFAFNNLYVAASGGCSTTKPSVLWAYNTGVSGGTNVTSPVLSGDGTKVAFVETRSSGGAILHILKGYAGQGTLSTATWAVPSVNNTTLTTWGTGTTCTASQSCMISLTFSNTEPDTNSSPYYDYSSDSLYVGDDNGSLHKFVNVFNGAPAECAGSYKTAPCPTASTEPYPVTVFSGQKLSSPVYDGSTNVYVGTGHANGGGTNGGGLAYVNAAAGTLTASSTTLDHAFGVVSAPIIDVSASKVYAFASNDGSSSCTSVNSSTACSNVVQFTTGFANSNGGTATHVGTGEAGYAGTLYHGTFDNNYFTAARTGTNKGYLYVCGNTAGPPTLYQIPITLSSMAMGTVVTGPALSSTNAAVCSPVTEFCNNSAAACTSNGTSTTAGKDYIFVSVQSEPSSGQFSGCTASVGCLMGFNVTTPSSFTTSMSATGVAAAAGGTSAIIIDNSVPAGTKAGASEIYYSTLSSGTCSTSTGTGGCVVQQTQAAP